jgi:type IV conjugative transfer system protein TraL
MTGEELRIPRFLDHPMLFPIWTKGETLCVVVPLLVLWLLFKNATGVILGAVVGATIFKHFRAFKAKQGDFVLPRFMYWYFPAELSMTKAFPPSHIREYVG